MNLHTLRLLAPRHRRIYSIDEVIELLDTWGDAPDSWRGRRAKRRLDRLPEATSRQLDIVLQSRLRREFQALLERHGYA